LFHFSSKVSTLTLECNDCGEEFEIPKKSDRITCKCPFCANILFIGSKGFSRGDGVEKAKKQPKKDLPNLSDWTPQNKKKQDFLFSPVAQENHLCPRCERFSEKDSRCEWCGFVFHKIENREQAPFPEDMRKGFEKVLQTSKIEKAYHELRQRPYMWDTHGKFIREISRASAWSSGIALVDQLVSTSRGDEKTLNLLSKTRMILQQGASITGELKRGAAALEVSYPERSLIRWAIYFFLGAFVGAILFLFLFGR
jgi:hypothetical protein